MLIIHIKVIIRITIKSSIKEGAIKQLIYVEFSDKEV